jgi:putative redox protein
MKESINLQWLSDMSFEANVDGHKIYMDSTVEHGGKNVGPRPKPLMMVALAGCTGMDVVSLLAKMRVEYKSLNIEVEGELTEDHPKRFVGMKIIYTIKGENIPLNKVEKAVRLSKENYCGVSANYTKAFPIEHEIIIE